MSCSTNFQDCECISRADFDDFILSSEYVYNDWTLFKIKLSLFFFFHSTWWDEEDYGTLWQNKSGFTIVFSTATQVICHPCWSQKIIEKANKYDQSAYETLTHEWWWLTDTFHSKIHYKTVSTNRRGWGWGTNLAWRCSRQNKLSRRLCDQLLLQISTEETDIPKPRFLQEAPVLNNLLTSASCYFIENSLARFSELLQRWRRNLLQCC